MKEYNIIKNVARNDLGLQELMNEQARMGWIYKGAVGKFGAYLIFERNYKEPEPQPQNFVPSPEQWAAMQKMMEQQKKKK